MITMITEHWLLITRVYKTLSSLSNKQQLMRRESVSCGVVAETALRIHPLPNPQHYTALQAWLWSDIDLSSDKVAYF